MAPTQGMLDLLDWIASKGGGVPQASLSQADKNMMRALLDRQMVNWDLRARTYRMTPAGRVAIGLPASPGGLLKEP
jgi:hypothetical protein